MKARLLLLTSTFFLICCALNVLISCNRKSHSKKITPSKWSGEYIFRLNEETSIVLDDPTLEAPPVYPWEDNQPGNLRVITKDYFRCKGNSQNPPKIISKDDKIVQRYEDCGGTEKHGLPIYQDKEYIAPILIEVLNDLQQKCGKPVVITCGHRCPQHQAYVDPSPSASASKHQIGAEVDFYVQGYENRPEEIIRLIHNFYQIHPRYQGRREYVEFTRYDKEISQLSTAPWLNKEIFIKLYKPHEGRNFDNRHPYPYISIQVRYDWENDERVTFSWERAKCYHR